MTWNTQFLVAHMPFRQDTMGPKNFLGRKLINESAGAGKAAVSWEPSIKATCALRVGQGDSACLTDHDSSLIKNTWWLPIAKSKSLFWVINLVAPLSLSFNYLIFFLLLKPSNTGPPWTILAKAPFSLLSHFLPFRFFECITFRIASLKPQVRQAAIVIDLHSILHIHFSNTCHPYHHVFGVWLSLLQWKLHEKRNCYVFCVSSICQEGSHWNLFKNMCWLNLKIK